VVIIGLDLMVFVAVIAGGVALFQAASRWTSSPSSSNLMPCPDCGYAVSVRDGNCPQCGCPVSRDRGWCSDDHSAGLDAGPAAVLGEDWACLVGMGNPQGSRGQRPCRSWGDVRGPLAANRAALPGPGAGSVGEDRAGLYRNLVDSLRRRVRLVGERGPWLGGLENM
jgi:hypothetical protein